MYLDQYSGNHSFRAKNVCDNINGNYPGIHFCDIRYENEENPFQVNRPDEIFIQGNHPLGVKLSTLLNGRYSSLSDLNNNKIRIERKGQNYLFSVEDELIGIIRDADDWDNILTTQWEKNDDSGFDDKDQAVFFGTTIEKIIAQFSLIKKQKRLTRSRKPVFPLNINHTALISYGVAISSSFSDNRNESDKQDYYGTEVRLDSVSGKKDREVANTQYDYSLFPLKREEFEELYKQLKDDILTIDNNASYPFLKRPFFKSIIENRGNNNSDIYVWIKFENVGDSSFDSYYFAVSYNKDTFNDVIVPQEANFLRQIFYLSSLSTKLLVEENKQKDEDQRRQSVKTAIGSIMSRNMSHNLGSHFLYYTKKDLEEDQKSFECLYNELHDNLYTEKVLSEVAIRCGENCFDKDEVKKTLTCVAKRHGADDDRKISLLLKKYYTRSLINLAKQRSFEQTDKNFREVLESVKCEFENKLPLVESGIWDEYSEDNGLSPYSLASVFEKHRDIDKEYWKAIGGAAHVIDFCKDRMNYVAAVVEDNKYPSMPVSLTFIIKKLLVDEEQYNGHTVNNYYIGNIVRSEGYSRKSYSKHRGFDTISFEVISENENTSIDDVILSLPGGVLSIHAFYNIIENFIRNSSKYQSSERKNKIKFTLRYKVQKGWVWFKLSDDKNDADITYDQIIENISALKFLNNDGTINQSSKGLKEIILSYLWLICWCYPTLSLGDVLYRWDEEIQPSDYKKSSHLKSFINQITNNPECDINFGRIDDSGNVINKKGCLCLHFSLPLHKESIILNSSDVKSIEPIKGSVKNTDLVLLQDLKGSLKDTFIYKHFPRVAVQIANIDPLADCINNRLGLDADNVVMKFGEYIDKAGNKPQIIYEGHKNVKGFSKNELEVYWQKIYFDSISGGNYTGILKNVISENYRLRLLVKEAALTRITIIDERIFDNIKQWVNKDSFFETDAPKPFAGTQIEQSLRNIRVLNYFETEPQNKNIKSVSGFEILRGSEFREVGPLKESPNATHFLTIHLGLIEKMLKNSSYLEEDSFCGAKNGSPLSPERVRKLMSKIKAIFFPVDNMVPFICIHSGRGGLSNELKDTELKEYPFIPYVTLEHLFNDSKYLLSSMFYSRIYENTR